MDERTLRIVLEAVDRSKGAFDAVRRHIGELRLAMARLTSNRDELGRFKTGFDALPGSILRLLNPLNLARGALGLLWSTGSAVFGALRGLLSGLLGAVFSVARAIGSALAGALQSMASVAAKAAAVAIAGLVGAMAMLAKQGISVNLSLGGTERGLAVMLKSASAAKQLVGEMKTLAETSMFEFVDIAGWGKQLVAMGFAANEVISTVRTLGDAVAGLGGGSEMIGRLIIALGQMRAKGVLSGEEVMQLTEAGVPARRYLEQAGLLEKGQDVARAKIDAPVGIKAMLAGMQRDFGGMQEGAMGTLPGIFSNIKDAINSVSASITTGLLASLTRAGKAVLDFVSSIQKTRDGARLMRILESTFNAVGAAIERLAARLPIMLRALVNFLDGERFTRFKAFAANAFETLVGAARTALGWLSANWEQAWNTIRNTAVGVIRVIVGTIYGLLAVYREWDAAHPTIGAKLKWLADTMISFGVAGLWALKPLVKTTIEWLGYLLMAGGALSTLMGNPISGMIAMGAGFALVANGAQAAATAIESVATELLGVDTSRIGERLQNAMPAFSPGGTFGRGYREGAGAVDDFVGRLGAERPAAAATGAVAEEQPLTPGWQRFMRQAPQIGPSADTLIPVPSTRGSRPFRERSAGTFTPTVPEVPQAPWNGGAIESMPGGPQHAQPMSAPIPGAGRQVSFRDSGTADAARTAEQHLRAAADALARLPDSMRRVVGDELSRLQATA